MSYPHTAMDETPMHGPDIGEAELSPPSDALLNAWLALEALTPQTFDKQAHLLGPEAHKRAPAQSAQKTPSPMLLPFNRHAGIMPWHTEAGDRRNLTLEDTDRIRWFVPLGFIRMKLAVRELATCVEDDDIERERG